MTPFSIFFIQFFWFLLVWSVIFYFVIWPYSQRLSTLKGLSLFIAPQMFRVLGLGLLVPNLSPGLSQRFAISTAIGDFLTAILALLAFIALQAGWRTAKGLAWVCTVFGILDILIVVSQAIQTQPMENLGVQWYVPVFVGPVMVLSHICCLIMLLRPKEN